MISRKKIVFYISKQSISRKIPFLQQQQQLAANNPTDQLINAIMRVSMFGDDRDNLLARWNLLQASWGIGKAYFANNQQPVNLNSDNPLCRFKAIGYSAIAKPGGGNIDNELLCIIIKKKPTEVEPLKQQLISGTLYKFTALFTKNLKK